MPDASQIPSVQEQRAMNAQINARLRGRACVWTETDDANGDPVWDTGCGQSQIFSEGTPESNEYKFCPYCGKKLVVK